MKRAVSTISKVIILLMTYSLCACHSEEEYDMEEKTLTLVKTIDGAPENLSYKIDNYVKEHLSPEYIDKDFCMICNNDDELKNLFSGHNPFGSFDMSQYSFVFAQSRMPEPYSLLHQYLSTKDGIGTFHIYIYKTFFGGWPTETVQYFYGFYPKTKLKDINFETIEAVSSLPKTDSIYVYQTKVPIKEVSKENMPSWLIDEMMEYQDSPGLYVFRGKFKNKDYYLVIPTLIYRQFYLYDELLFNMDGTREEGEIFSDLVENHLCLLDDMKCIYYHVLTDDAMKMNPIMKIDLYKVLDKVLDY